jgi:hypothetical protein
MSRTVRTLLSKTGKALDHFHVQEAMQSQKLEAYELQIAELRQKRRKKIAIDANRTFADIETIKAVQEEQRQNQAEWDKRDRAKEARRTANEMISRDITQFQFEFHVNSVGSVDSRE